MRKYNYIIYIVAAILVISLAIVFYNKNKDTESNIIQNSIQEENENKKIKELSNQINSTANSDMYEVEKEYDGRQILQIKPEVQFSTDLAGIIKDGKPEENEIEELVEKAPNKSGIWISKQSIEKFKQILQDNEIKEFEISQDGYLKIYKESNEIERKLKKMSESNKLYIINVTGIAYQRDYITGEIEEYPFEDMDPFQILEPYEQNEKVILEVTTNKNNKLSNNEILENITNY